jgi:DNA-binding response OmpR family regulator
MKTFLIPILFYKKSLEWEKIHIIFITARIDETAQDAGKFLGDVYISKPYDSDEVLKIIKDKTDIKHG